MAAPRRRTERSESAAERARKAPRRFPAAARPNRLAEQKTVLLCAFLPFSLFCKAFSKFS